jgi:DNA-3-methyladenine glycosylase II
LRRIIFSVEPRPPFRLDLTVWAIRRRRGNLIDSWDGETYQRVLSVRGKPVLLSVTQQGPIDAPGLKVVASGERGSALVRAAVVLALERLLGLQIDPSAFYELASKQRRMHELASRFRGLKPPRFPSVWEGVVNGIACQQLSLTVWVSCCSIDCRRHVDCRSKHRAACDTRFQGRKTFRLHLRRPFDH